MSNIPDYVLNEIKCCLDEDKHVLLEPVILKCGGNACKGCINDPNKSSVKCFKCNSTHKNNDFTENKSTESLVRVFMNDLSKNLDDEIKSMKDLLKEENVLDEMQLKIETLEDQMDMRVESLITEIHKYRDEYMEKLKKFKLDLQNLVKDSNILEKTEKQEIETNKDSYKFFQEKQRELKIFKKEMLNYRRRIEKFKFAPSKFNFTKEQFGLLETHSFHLGLLEICPSWLNSSLILNDEEARSLAEITQSSKGNLLYRATQDGFTANEFHSKCDGESKTITIIKTNTNYVFGGYTSSAWNSEGDYIFDSNAFIFSLRRNGVSKCEKFMVKNPDKAIIGHRHYGPIFGGGYGHAVNKTCYGSGCSSFRFISCGHGSSYSYISRQGLESGCDIFIRGSNSSSVCEANIGHSYQCPEGYTYGQQNTINFLAGSKKNWLTTEIEVYKINEFFD